MSSFFPSRCPYSIDAFKIETLIQDIQNEFDAVLDSGEFHKFKDILGETEIFNKYTVLFKKYAPNL